MDRQPGTLEIKMESISNQAMYWLEPAMAGDDFYRLEDLAEDILNDKASLFNIYKGRDMIGSFVLRQEHHPGGGSEIVIVAAGGRYPGQSLYKLITPWIEQIAANAGAQSLRGHTKRAGVGRLMENAGFAPVETVYRKEVQYGRRIQ